MIVDDRLSQKMDPLLQDVLMQAEGDEPVTVVMTLGSEIGQALKFAEPPIDPADFPDGTEYRRALIAYRQQEMQRVLGQTLQQLHDLKLKVETNRLSKVVIAEGSTRQVFDALQLPGVIHATIDQPLGWIGSVPDDAVDHIAGLVTEIFESAQGQGEGLISQPLNDRTRGLIRNAAYNYVQNYYNLHARIRLFGRRDEVDLESLYTPVQCRDHLRPEFESIESLEQEFKRRLSGDSRGRSVRRDGIEVANECAKLMVLGSPGAGKTTFLRKVGLEALRGKIQHRSLPILIELKRINSPEIKIFDLILNELRNSGFPSAKAWLLLALDQGKLLLLLDGLNEVPSQTFDPVIKKIAEFTKQYDRNRLIASCRTAAYHNFSDFTDLETVKVSDFDDDQIKQYTQLWFKGESDKLWKEIEKNQTIKELARTPLLLIFLCLVFDKSQSLPANRSTLYQRALRILLEEWNSLKRLNQDEVFQYLGVDLEESILAEIAYTRFAEDRLFFPKQKLLQDLDRLVRSNINAPKQLKAPIILNAIEVQQGILVERTRDIYSFSHLTLQEYLTARYIVSKNLIAATVDEHLEDEHWREVFLLIAGLMERGGDELLNEIEDRIFEMYTGKIENFFNWVYQLEQNIFTEDGSVTLQRRVHSISCAFHAAITIGFDINLQRDLFSSISDLVRTLNCYSEALLTEAASIGQEYPYSRQYFEIMIENALEYIATYQDNSLHNFSDLKEGRQQLESLKNQIPNDDQSLADKIDFDTRIYNVLLKCLNLSNDLITFSEEERSKLRDCLYANLLMIECRDAAIKVDQETWKKIESRMFMPKSKLTEEL